MKKSVLSVSMISTLTLLFSCGGDKKAGGNVPSTTDARASFTSPTGKLTSSNVTTVSNDSIDLFQSADTGGSFLGFAGAAKRKAIAVAKSIYAQTTTPDISSCISGDSKKGTVDFGCLDEKGILDDNSSQCKSASASGKMTIEPIGDTGKRTKYTYKNIAFSCDEESAKINGSLEVDLTDANKIVSCFDFVAIINGEEQKEQGCYSDDDVLASGDGGEVVCTNVVTDATCDKATLTFNTSEGEKTVTCDVAKKDSTCSSAEDIEDVSNCTL